ncbi:BAG domain-containing protein [Mycena chlorophos]|uniref:BAG domain-containing protein n=1 Tax=Mycena chlorophos TaxID=658473 RepID=A0A8H6T451_MYCCL|nr:BAG domain-containing protein [Mycena chlorophos]
MFSSYRPSPRDKYLAAVAQAQAAEAEYLAAERLQQEEDALRYRLQQIQSMKQPRYDDDLYYPTTTRYAPAPTSFDLDALRRQIAAEERERILREQEQERRRELEARKARERERAQQVRLAALVNRSTRPTRYVDFNDLIAARKPKPAAVNVNDVLGNLFGAVQEQQPALEQILGSLFGQQQAALASKEVKAEPKQPEAAAPFEQLLNAFAGALQQHQQPTQSEAPKASSSKTPEPEPKKSAEPSAPHPGLEQLFGHFLGPQANHVQVDMSQLFNMFTGGCQPRTTQPESSKQASCSQSTEAKLKTDLQTRLQSDQAKEDADLAEAIRMSLADLDAANTTTEDPKGKSPAPAPVPDLASSAAEIKVVETTFTSLANEWVFPEQLDFSTSRTSSPAPRGSGASEGDSVMSRLTYSAHNQPVRYYHGALSKLLARLDAVDSFGDEEVRHARKEAVGKVEGALDELESVVAARWRKFAGRAERAPEAAPEESAETIRPYDMDTPASPVDTFLLPAEPTSTETIKPVEKSEVEGSDWSEVDA